MYSDHHSDRAMYSDHHSDGTVTLYKMSPDIVYHQFQKWTVEFLSRFESRGIKISKGNSIHIIKPINLFNLLCGLLFNNDIYIARSLRALYANGEKC